MDALAWIFGVAWALCGAAAAARVGNLGLWRITIWLGPLAFFIFPPRDRTEWPTPDQDESAAATTVGYGDAWLRSNLSDTIAAGGGTEWVRCPGCSGEIGIPPAWPAEAVCCPKCSAVVRIDERMRVLWRPAEQLAAPALEPGGSREWIACNGCRGEIGVPREWIGPTIACPKCGSIVAMRETGKVLWRPPPEAAGVARPQSGSQAFSVGESQGAHAWKRPAAAVFLTLGTLAFFSSAVIGGQGSIEAGLLAGMLNPIFFVGVPLGWYWWRSAGGTQSMNVQTRGKNAVLHQTSAGSEPAAPASIAEEKLSAYKRKKQQRRAVNITVLIVLSLGALIGCLIMFAIHDSWEHSAGGAVAKIEWLGGRVTREGVGTDQRVVAVDLHDTLAGDFDLDCLRHLPWTKRLDLSQTAVTDHLMFDVTVHSIFYGGVERLPNLEWVSFRQTRVTKEGIAALAQAMPWLTIVDADGVSATGREWRARGLSNGSQPTYSPGAGEGGGRVSGQNVSEATARRPYWTWGSTKSLVEEIEGPPQSVHKYPATGWEEWTYRSFDKVRFALDSGKAYEWDNVSGQLSIALVVDGKIMIQEPDATFGQGSTVAEVLRAQGTPRSMTTYPARGIVEWGYNTSDKVNFDARTRRVTEWDNQSGLLRVAPQ
ncbi:MAG TPA: hypothetical protein VG826_34925 [Pirellulales bacterium]|nr:hypothetical protein [Pirellulales bacterium]